MRQPPDRLVDVQVLQEQGHRHVGEHDDLELQGTLVTDDGNGTPVSALRRRREVVVVESGEVKR